MPGKKDFMTMKAGNAITHKQDYTETLWKKHTLTLILCFL
jgi:hypothetical protein